MLSALIKRLSGWLLAVPAALALPAVFAGFIGGLEAWWRSPGHLSLLPGLPVGVALAWAISRWAHVLRTFEHELTHALVGLPFGLIPYGFIVTHHRGGLVKQFSIPLPLPFALWPILGARVSGLAPYSIPLFALALTLFAPRSWVLLVGVALGYHVYCKPGEIWSNLGWRSFEGPDGGEGHTDIAQSGYLLSLVLIPALALASYGVLFHALASGPSQGVAEWAHAVARGLGRTVAWAAAALGW
ncbi:MAG: hypothetical protein FJZ01_15885 [Candidatus Sericytochromatia bacterium]|nr:hypothetical protein [Candidatus Tanganyikabacteria bacterium]